MSYRRTALLLTNPLNSDTSIACWLYTVKSLWVALIGFAGVIGCFVGMYIPSARNQK